MPTSGFNDVVNISQHGTYDLLQIVYPFRGDGKFYMRNRGSGIGTWSPWLRIWHSGNFANGTTSQYIRGDGSLATYTDTTYSVMSAAEASTGTATTARTISAKVLADEINRRGDLRYLSLTGGILTGDIQYGTDTGTGSYFFGTTPSTNGYGS